MIYGLTNTHKEQVKWSSNKVRVSSACFISHLSRISAAFSSLSETPTSCASTCADLRSRSFSLFASALSRAFNPLGVPEIEAIISEEPIRFSLHCELRRRGPETEVTSECLVLRLLAMGISTSGTRVVFARVTIGGGVNAATVGSFRVGFT